MAELRAGEVADTPHNPTLELCAQPVPCGLTGQANANETFTLCSEHSGEGSTNVTKTWFSSLRINVKNCESHPN